VAIGAARQLSAIRPHTTVLGIVAADDCVAKEADAAVSYLLPIYAVDGERLFGKDWRRRLLTGHMKALQ
jgi:hypothetical protein